MFVGSNLKQLPIQFQREPRFHLNKEKRLKSLIAGTFDASSPLTIMIRSRSTAGTITSLYLRAEQAPAVKRQEDNPSIYVNSPSSQT